MHYNLFVTTSIDGDRPLGTVTSTSSGFILDFLSFYLVAAQDRGFSCQIHIGCNPDSVK